MNLYKDNEPNSGYYETIYTGYGLLLTVKMNTTSDTTVFRH